MISLQNHIFLKNNQIGFNVFPNPSQGRFQLSLTEPFSKGLISIYNSIGIKIQNIELLNSSKIDISNYPVGIYYCVIKKGGNFLETHKFIVN